MENPADGCEIILRPIRLVEQGGAMPGEESVQKGLRETDHFHLDPGGPGNISGFVDVIEGQTAPRR